MHYIGLDYAVGGLQQLHQVGGRIVEAIKQLAIDIEVAQGFLDSFKNAQRI